MQVYMWEKLTKVCLHHSYMKRYALLIIFNLCVLRNYNVLCTMFLHIYAYVYMCVHEYTNTDNYTYPLTLYIQTRILGV